MSRVRGTTGKRVVLVAAVADNGVVGRNGDLPWRIPEDMAHFRAITRGNTVVMGRKTYDSIGRPLPERTNIVVTRQDDWSAAGVHVAHSVKDAIARAQDFAGDIMVIGGAQVYETAMDHANVQVLTEVHQTPDGDTYYPAFERAEWSVVRREEHDGYARVWYERPGRPEVRAGGSQTEVRAIGSDASSSISGSPRRPGRSSLTRSGHFVSGGTRMLARLAVVLSAALMISTAGAVAFAHDDGKGAVHSPSMQAQEHEFENVAASKANENGNAPRSFAPCIKGMAAKTYPCDGVDMMSHLTRADLGLSFVNDIWGWTDPRTGDEYAMVGGIEGTVFVDISDPKRPDVVGILPTHSTEGGQVWRDIKVYDDHAFVVSEHTDHGLQVFDLTQLRDVGGQQVVFEETAHYDEFGSAHNLNINEDSGFAYVVGSQTCEGGLHMVDINDPTSPDFAGCLSDAGYIHDTQCVIYDGPDATYRGREICFNSNAEVPASGFEDIENTLTITDVTDKANPVVLSRVFYDNDGYSHQGWLTPDQGYFLHGDELDEVIRGINTTTRVWDVRDLENPAVIGAHDNATTSIDHNIYTEGDRAFASNYTSGLRVFDTGDVADGELSEVGFFDVYPENDKATFEGGTWSNYPYYDQKMVAVSSIDRGLFVLKPRGNVGP